ncbi:type II secretion system protein GspG [Nonlabens sp.]|uniref:type II secretion system protein GspG n=1 Tax=Nonlabens sp. TaxID=1888209 RepID=UPI0032634759
MYDLVSILVDFALLRKDYKHRKNIEKLEKEDGIKRPFQKYMMRPSVVIYLIVLFLALVLMILFITYQRTITYPKNTQQEIMVIAGRVENWYEINGSYPSVLEELIGSNPIRKEWKTDAWKREYQFTLSDDGKSFFISSAGADGKHGTNDDINSY